MPWKLKIYVLTHCLEIMWLTFGEDIYEPRVKNNVLDNNSVEITRMLVIKSYETRFKLIRIGLQSISVSKGKHRDEYIGIHGISIEFGIGKEPWLMP